LIVVIFLAVLVWSGHATKFPFPDPADTVCFVNCGVLILKDTGLRHAFLSSFGNPPFFIGMDSAGQRNTYSNLYDGDWKPKVFRGRLLDLSWFSSAPGFHLSCNPFERRCILDKPSIIPYL